MVKQLLTSQINNHSRGFRPKPRGGSDFDIKIIPQKSQGVNGINTTYGVIVNGWHRKVCYSREELESYLRGLEGVENAR